MKLKNYVWYNVSYTFQNICNSIDQNIVHVSNINYGIANIKKYLKGKNRKRIEQEQKPLKKVFKCIGNVVNVKVFERNYKKASNSGN